MELFLLFGQSNMAGGGEQCPGGVPLWGDESDGGAEDLIENASVQALGFDDHDDGEAGRRWNVWATARPPLHRTWNGLGPGDSFGKAMAAAWPGKTIGLIPCAMSGVDIDFFRKGVISAQRDRWTIPPDNAKTSAYDMVVERVRLAQEDGTVRGILFHQGESDAGSGMAWLGKVEEIVSDLRSDLGLNTEEVPFVAGELLHGKSCSGLNSTVNQIPLFIPNAFVVTADGLTPLDDYHFDLPSVRTLGRRYADVMLGALGVEGEGGGECGGECGGASGGASGEPVNKADDAGGAGGAGGGLNQAALSNGGEIEGSKGIEGKGEERAQ